MVTLHNLWVFVQVVLTNGIPPWDWKRTWKELEYEHSLRVHKVIWNLKCKGKIHEKDGKLYYNGEAPD